MLTSPVVRCVKKQLGAEVHFLTKQSFQSILAPNPYIDKVYTIQNRVGEVMPQLKKERYDIIIDLHKNLRTFLIGINLPFVKRYSFNKLNFKKWLLVNFKINRLPKLHLVDRYFEGIKALGVSNDGEGLDYFINQEESALADILPEKEFTAIVIGAGYPTKALMIPQIVSIINNSSEQYILLGGQAERAKAVTIMKNLQRPVIDLVGQLTLSQSAYCIKRATQVITGDTGLMHIAAAFQKPIISIWGNTVPEFGMYPYYGNEMKQAKLLQVPNLSCRPCSKIGYEQCPKGHFNCIKGIDLSNLRTDPA